MSKKSIFKDALITVAVLAFFFFVSLAVHTAFNTKALIQPFFVLAVFLISMMTNGYFYGITAALISVMAVNFAFTFPYFAFNFTIQENIISTIILIIVTMATSTLSTIIKKQEKVRLQQGGCSIDAGFVWSDLLTNLERVSDHCSNIAGCVIEASHHNLNLHEGARIIKSESEDFRQKFHFYSDKYSITN